MKFRSDVEGLRAVAIVPVVIFHASSSLVPGGFVGVDVFFVISGFLISKIILDEVETNSFSFISFYRRRIRRIFPALFFMLAATSVAAYFILTPHALVEYGRTLLATALFVSNMEFLRISGYFDGSVEFKPLLHTWSLAVEEQFYIIFPVILIATKKWLGGRFLAVFSVCAVASLLMSEWLTLRFPEQAFYFGPTRAYELLIGAVLALDVLPRLSSRVVREGAAAIGLAMIAYSVVGFSKNTAFPGVTALVPCIGTALIIYAGQAGSSAVGGLLSVQPVRFVGAVSYSLYLWHWPILALARNYYLGVLTPVQIVCAVMLAAALAVFSRHFVEQPFLSRQRKLPLFIPAGAAVAGTVALGFAMMATAGFPNRYPEESLRLFADRENYNHRRPECHGVERKLIPYNSNCIYGDGTAPTMVAVWGDSHGAELSLALGDAMGSNGAVMQITASACPPALDFSTKLRPLCGAHNQDAFINLTKDARIRSVVLVARYEQYRDEWAVFIRGFERAIAGLVAAGKEVVVVDPFPNFSYPVPDALGILLARGITPENYRLARAQYQAENVRAIADLKMLVAKYGIAQATTESIMCNQDYCSATQGKTALYFDDNHLSVGGAQRLATSIVPLLSNPRLSEQKKGL